MDNWVVVPCRNNAALLKTGLESLLAQSIPVRIFAINNGSTDAVPFILNTLDSKHIVLNIYPQLGVAGAWNLALTYLFDKEKADRVLVVNQDIELLPETYRILDEQNLPFVSCVSTGTREFLQDTLHRESTVSNYHTRPHPDFSCYLIRKDCYRAIGKFDEGYYPAWFEDNDYHIRAARAGIELCCIDLPFYHYSAGTMKGASEEERRDYYCPAFDRNKQRFLDKWGVLPGTKDYENMCDPKYYA